MPKDILFLKTERFLIYYIVITNTVKHIIYQNTFKKDQSTKYKHKSYSKLVVLVNRLESLVFPNDPSTVGTAVLHILQRVDNTGYPETRPADEKTYYKGY